MEASPLDKLAPELREMIYKHSLIQPDGFTLVVDTVEPAQKQITALQQRQNLLYVTKNAGQIAHDLGLVDAYADTTDQLSILLQATKPRRVVRAEGATPHLLALTVTCKAIRHECLPLVYTKNSFRLKETYAMRSQGMSHDPRYARLSSWGVTVQQWFGFTTDRQLIRQLEIVADKTLMLGADSLPNPNLFRRNIASVYQALLDFDIPSTVNMTLGYSLNDNGPFYQTLELPLNAAAFRKVVETEFAEKGRELLRQRSTGVISSAEWAHKHHDLHELRRQRQPYLKNMAEKLEGLERLSNQQTAQGG